ncbi:unnamed protein product [Ranitomeya imitator]|uniref:Uncharacterized protein n=1 Tax=Ranitomeya imitator TaxID=111125 RepID=A0ABN9MA44_9NEOB|nr:unnamed protein product [Ranitomeya imitator]
MESGGEQQQQQLSDEVRQKPKKDRGDQPSRKSSSAQGSRASTRKEPPRIPVLDFGARVAEESVSTANLKEMIRLELQSCEIKSGIGLDSCLEERVDGWREILGYVQTSVVLVCVGLASGDAAATHASCAPMFNMGDACVFVCCVVRRMRLFCRKRRTKKTQQVAFFLRPIVGKKRRTRRKTQRFCVRFAAFLRASCVASPTQRRTTLTPGEGEHKIMEFIRSEKTKPDHDPNTRHCLYGLDADLPSSGFDVDDAYCVIHIAERKLSHVQGHFHLAQAYFSLPYCGQGLKYTIMLGLTSHEVHFSLLREEVRFGGKKNQKRVFAPEETTFHLLHLSLMREYIDYEFSSLKVSPSYQECFAVGKDGNSWERYFFQDKISFEYDVERIIDDWILMGFLVGNDFIPHLPHLHINHDALPLLYRTYTSVLPELGGYINENGYLNLVHFEKYLVKLSAFDREHFNEIFVDLKWFESKVGNKYLNEAAGQAAEEAQNCKKKKSKGFDDALCLGALEKDGEKAAKCE